MQLISTWLPVPDEILVAEIDKACKYQGASGSSLLPLFGSETLSARQQQQLVFLMTPFHCPLQCALSFLIFLAPLDRC